MMNYVPVDKNIAKKYAKAFMAVFPKSFTLNDIGKIEATYFFLQKNKRTLFFLQLPQFDEQRKESMIADLIGYFALPHAFTQLFMLLITHNRSFYIPDVLWFMIELYKEQTNSVSFSLQSPHSLDHQQIESIKQFLGRLVGKNIIATTMVDPSLIAGLRLQSNNNLWEYSVRKQIQSLRALKK
jgi:F-type H+-transporting ATPase subunit delta